ncbi:MAG: hypothetical protein H7210_05690, partial [Pyrinomonadaceae bacterium]|nr:hypothetical protein [Phycisphaerales bacterium]
MKWLKQSPSPLRPPSGQGVAHRRCKSADLPVPQQCQSLPHDHPHTSAQPGVSARTRRSGARRGTMLLEVMLALALFIGAGAAVLSIVGQSVGSLKATRERQHAVDLARSAMAELEAG